MQPEARNGYADVAARPLVELLACPPSAGNLLNTSSQFVDFREGDVLFRQGSPCQGLYVVLSGELLRKAERLDTRLVLGTVRPGELVELAAALGDGIHTYTLSAQTAGSIMKLPLEALQNVFLSYPPLRMRLLEELAREVSRGYRACCATRLSGIRRRAHGPERDDN